MDVSWHDRHDQWELGLLFQAKGGRHSKNMKGRVEMEDGLQNTLAHFNELTSKGSSMKWDGVCLIEDKEGEEFLFCQTFQNWSPQRPLLQ
jgi:hypothetical protein